MWTRSAVLGLGLMAMLPLPASASLVEVSGSGTFNAAAPTTSISNPGASFSFSFEVNDPVPAFGIAPTIPLNPVYVLNGVTISPTFFRVEFVPIEFKGLLDLYFPNGALSQVLTLYGRDVGSSGSLTLGMFPGVASIDSDGSLGSATVTLAPVPLPASAPMLGAALVALGAVGCTLKRKAATV